MKISRRNFVKTGGLMAFGLFGLAGFAKASIGADDAPHLLSSPLQSQNCASFRRMIGTDFTIYGDDFAVASKLNAVSEFPSSTPENVSLSKKFDQMTAECFHLDFQVPTEDFEQNVYQIYHPQIGRFELLLTSGENTGGGKIMTAVINRI